MHDCCTKESVRKKENSQKKTALLCSYVTLHAQREKLAKHSCRIKGRPPVTPTPYQLVLVLWVCLY